MPFRTKRKNDPSKKRKRHAKRRKNPHAKKAERALRGKKYFIHLNN